MQIVEERQGRSGWRRKSGQEAAEQLRAIKPGIDPLRYQSHQNASIRGIGPERFHHWPDTLEPPNALLDPPKPEIVPQLRKQGTDFIGAHD
jgi:hypothetical protein